MERTSSRETTRSMVTHRGRWAVGGALSLAGVLVLLLDLLVGSGLGSGPWWLVTVGLCLTGALVAQSARTRVRTASETASSPS
ncbi:hypothetical protein [Nesterenkonia sp. F]|uniref:hypothetical protein n=1 Tax=Nesterenkonia sp. F TaxID=795955 RepID=UPI000255C992|nr:hypothetical protein [Nesterenkonia sp. F]